MNIAGIGLASAPTSGLENDGENVEGNAPTREKKHNEYENVESDHEHRQTGRARFWLGEKDGSKANAH
jgi:hypothetical protein